jgi:hypothetical protein
LEPQQLDFSKPRPGVSANRCERGIDFGELRASSPEWLEVGLGEFVECLPLHRSREEALMGVLPMEVDES